jgi:hypothetical protein
VFPHENPCSPGISLLYADDNALFLRRCGCFIDIFSMFSVHHRPNSASNAGMALSFVGIGLRYLWD